MTVLLLNSAVLLCLLFAFTNGMKDGSNVLATAVASGSVRFCHALMLVIIAELIGPFLFGIPVALTMAQGIIRVDILPHNIDSLLLILSGLGGAIILNLLSWLLRLPTSSSFILVGGLIGPVLTRYGLAGIPWRIFLVKVVGAVFLSPFLGILCGMLIYTLLAWLLGAASWKTNRHLKKLQIGGLIILGMNHGTNDSQKAMGLIALLLLLAGKLNRLEIPGWVMAASIGSLAAGIALGGTKIIKTVGYSIYRIRPVHSFGSQLSASLVLLGCNLIGAPVSTTQIISSSVMGVGNACRERSVRWQIIRSILLSWLLTIPLSGGLASLVYLVLSRTI